MWPWWKARRLSERSDRDEAWLVTGGAGYIGGHVVAALRSAGLRPVVLDDLSAGVAERVAGVPLAIGEVQDERLVTETLRAHRVRGVIHLAALKAVGESEAQPARYYQANVGGLACLLSAMATVGIEQIVYSSSASVYGITGDAPVAEDAPLAPISPYGETKLLGEWLLSDVARATGLRYVALRYFNVAGASSPLLADRGCANLIPLALRALESGVAAAIFGDDYDTPDGTCIRDYVHVEDIAAAHVAAIAAVRRAGAAATYNVGTGTGHSVREVIDALREATGISTKPEIKPRRAGDPASSTANVDHIAHSLGWRAKHDLSGIVASAVTTNPTNQKSSDPISPSDRR